MELIEHPLSQELDFSIKTTQIIKYSDAIEYGIKNLHAKDKEMYGTFFFHLFWGPMDGNHDESYIDKAKYTGNFLSDDLGWLKID